MLYEQIADYNSSYSSFAPFAKGNNRAAWEALDSEWCKSNLELGKSYLDFKFQGINATDFLEFTKTGNRTNYEDKLFSKRKALSALVLAECIEYKGNFIEAIINGIFSICEESAWFLPAHNSYIRDTPQLPLPDATNPVLELFSCETGAILATVLYLLEDELAKISPFIPTRIRYELRNRIFTPYLTRHFWWMGNGDEPMCNWTIWCTQNVLISAFLSGECDLAELDAIAKKAAKSSDLFLKDYGEDGCCDEGAQYYRHSGLCLYNVLDILESVTGRFKVLYENPKVQNIATYIMKMHVAGPYYFNFADCSPIAGRAGAREFLFARAINCDEMMTYAARDYLINPDALLMKDENNLYYRLQNGFTVKAVRNYILDLEKKGVFSDNDTRVSEIFYPSTGIFITGDKSLSLAVKAGHNGDSHNHNDTGSFTVYSKGFPFIIDIGVESYTKKTFSPDRYEIWTMQSAFHNLPTFDGIMEKDGKEFAAKDITYSFGKDSSEISMDISGAFPIGERLSAFTRKVTLNKGNCIEVLDEAKWTGSPMEVIQTIMTYAAPTRLDDGRIKVDDLGIIESEGFDFVGIEEYKITDERLMIAWKGSIYRILLRAVNAKTRIKLIAID